MVDIRYLGVRAGSGASIATLRLASSAIAKAHEWAGHESPCRDQGVCASLKGWGRRLAKPQRQAGALTADVLAVIRLTAVQPRKRGRGHETEEQAPQRGKFDVALVAVLSDAGLRRSEAAALTWGDVQRWDDGSGRITIIRSKTDVGHLGAGPSYIRLLKENFQRRPPRALQWRATVLARLTGWRWRIQGGVQTQSGDQGNGFTEGRWGRGGRHPRRHACPGRHPAGGPWWCGEGVRAVGIADCSPGEGDRQGRGLG